MWEAAPALALWFRLFTHTIWWVHPHRLRRLPPWPPSAPRGGPRQTLARCTNTRGPAPPRLARHPVASSRLVASAGPTNSAPTPGCPSFLDCHYPGSRGIFALPGFPSCHCCLRPRRAHRARRDSTHAWSVYFRAHPLPTKATARRFPRPRFRLVAWRTAPRCCRRYRSEAQVAHASHAQATLLRAATGAGLASRTRSRRGWN